MHQILPQSVDGRLTVSGNVNTLLYHTFAEQKKLNLTWCKTIIITSLGTK
jgi:hypothetical protein